MSDIAGKKTTDTNASPSGYGWDFQVGAGIVLMLDNVKTFISMKMEGASDDIELTLETGKIYAQAKSVTQMGDQSSASTNLTKALITLSKDAGNGDAVKLIYITNIINPFSSKISSDYQYGGSYEFSILPTDVQMKIRSKVDRDFPTDIFEVHILHFFGEGKNKFNSIKTKIAEFLRESIDDISYSNQLLESWFTTFMANAADKPTNKKPFELKKKDIIFPVIVLVIDRPTSENDFIRVCNHNNYSEVVQRFREIINRNICDYEFVAGVLGDFLIKRNLFTDKANYKYSYVTTEWRGYEQQFSVIKNQELREAVIKLLLLSVINQSGKISDIRRATNL